MYSSLFFILLAHIVYGLTDFDDTISLGDSYQYNFEDANFRISFEEYDSAAGAARFIVQDQDISLTKYGSAMIGSIHLLLLSVENTASGIDANYKIINATLKCHKLCKQDFFTNFANIFGVQVCKEEMCSYYCDKYNKQACIEGHTLLIYSCSNMITNLSPCTKREVKFNGCFSDQDCKAKCISGVCTETGFALGDGICALGLENASSPDCSYSNKPYEKPASARYPLVLIHGFTSSPDTFSKLHSKLIKDGHYQKAEFPISEEECKKLLLSNTKPVFAISYYNANQETSFHEYYFSSEFIKSKKKSPVEILAAAIDDIKKCTLSPKVDIIAHSNGGLLVREYLLQPNTQKNINKLILLGSPNHGEIYGDQWVDVAPGLRKFLGNREDILKSCRERDILTGLYHMVQNKDLTQECAQFDELEFYANLNRIDETPGLIEYYTIAGNSEGIGDGLATVQSAALDGATNWVVPCNHFNLKVPSSCPESYEFISRALNLQKKDKSSNWFTRILQ